MMMLINNCEISCFRHSVNEVFALLGCYAALIGSKLLMFRDSYRRFGMVYLSHIQGLAFLDCLTFEDETERLTRNVGNLQSISAA